jgi:hypothetical protein
VIIKKIKPVYPHKKDKEQKNGRIFKKFNLKQFNNQNFK